MKIQFKILALSFAVLAMVFTACEKTETETDLTDEEAAEIVENAVSPETGGFSTQMTEAAIVADLIIVKHPLCGKQFDSTRVIKKTSGARTFDYTFDWTWGMVCDSNNDPQAINYSYTMDGTYDTPRWSSDDDASHTFQLTGLAPADPFFLYDGNYTRNGFQASKVGQQRSVTSVFTASTTGTEIDKNTHEVHTGTVNFSLTGSVSNGNTFSKVGTIVFNGNGTATITINGNTWTIQV